MNDSSTAVASDRVSRLTEKERETLRLVPLHGTVLGIAREIGVSENAIKQRLKSATKKLGVVGRHDAARLLAEAEGWGPFPNRVAPIGQVEDQPAAMPSEDVGSSISDLAPAPGQPPTGLTLFGAVLSRIGLLPTNFGERNELTAKQRALLITLITLLSLIAFVMALAVLTELGRFGASIASPGFNTI